MRTGEKQCCNIYYDPINYGIDKLLSGPNRNSSAFVEIKWTVNTSSMFEYTELYLTVAIY